MSQSLEYPVMALSSSACSESPAPMGHAPSMARSEIMASNIDEWCRRVWPHLKLGDRTVLQVYCKCTGGTNSISRAMVWHRTEYPNGVSWCQPYVLAPYVAEQFIAVNWQGRICWSLDIVNRKDRFWLSYVYASDRRSTYHS